MVDEARARSCLARLAIRIVRLGIRERQTKGFVSELFAGHRAGSLAINTERETTTISGFPSSHPVPN